MLLAAAAAAVASAAATAAAAIIGVWLVGHLFLGSRLASSSITRGREFVVGDECHCRTTALLRRLCLVVGVVGPEEHFTRFDAVSVGYFLE